jgi:hypothetical protein
MRNIPRFLPAVLALIFFGAPSTHAQGVRIGPQAVTAQGTIGAATNAVVLPAAPHVTICVHPANGIPCTNYAATFTDVTTSTACGQTTQLVLDGTTNCVANPDSQNNWGAWVKPGQYDVTISLPGGVNLGPYFVTASLPVNPNVQIVSTVPTGTAPFSIASTTVVPNLNAQLHNGLTAPGSAIVGVSDTQTLTSKTLMAPVVTSPSTTGTDSGAETLGNKTLTSASTGNSVSILNAQKDAAAIVGTGAALTVYTYTIPANTVANLKGFRLTTSFSHTTGNGTVNYLISLNGQTLWSLSISTTNFGTVGLVVLNSGSTTGDCALTTQWQSGGVVLSPTVSGLSWSSNQVLTVTFSAAATEQVTPIMWLVEQIQ